MHENGRIRKDFLGSLLVFFLAVFLFVGVVVLSCICGGEIMRIFGFTYQSMHSLLLFFIVGAIISWPISLAAEAIPHNLCFSRRLISKGQAVIMYIVLATLSTAAGLLIVNEHIQGVAANNTSVLVVSLLLALLNCHSIIVSRPENT